jgi:hypothetical protein
VSEHIVSRQAIAHQAELAARTYLAAGQGAQRPQPPYCPQFEPSHWQEWQASFKRALHSLTAPEGAEGGA